MTLRDRMVGGVLGLVVGDALGVPVEFKPRALLRNNSVTGMTGFGTHHQPPGTWSDDSSLALATLESLLDGYDPHDMMRRFSRWLREGYMTAHGEVFDVGGTTNTALAHFADRLPRDEWGEADERSNGNGSLMRILPLSLYVHRMDPAEVITRSMEVSALTHAHIRSRLCCAYYSLVVKAILEGRDLAAALAFAAGNLKPHVPEAEAKPLRDILSGAIITRGESRISGAGYVVATLEASLWCCARYPDFSSAVLVAVNLGEDTDTTGAVTGGLAGVMYGEQAIPPEWVKALARSDDVQRLAAAFADEVSG